jgi:hypothetical protein
VRYTQFTCFTGTKLQILTPEELFFPPLSVVDIGELSSFLAEMRDNDEELIDHDLFESWLEASTSMVEAGIL